MTPRYPDPAHERAQTAQWVGGIDAGEVPSHALPSATEPCL